MTTSLSLRLPTVTDEARTRELDAAFTDENFSFLAGNDGISWEEFLATVQREHEGTDLPPGRVPADFLLAVVDDRVIGRASIRYALNDYLLNYGGHIGCAVAPEHRRKGHATEILRESLALLAARGIDRALVTCDDDNVGSYRTIEACGGVLENTIDGPDGVLKRRYWIDIASDATYFV